MFSFKNLADKAKAKLADLSDEATRLLEKRQQNLAAKAAEKEDISRADDAVYVNILDLIRCEARHLDPKELGYNCAQAVWDRFEGEFSRLTIDCYSLPAEYLISAFFVGFWDFMHDKGVLKESQKISWRPRFDYQRQSISYFMKVYKP